MREYIFKQEDKTGWATLKATCFNDIDRITKGAREDFVIKIARYNKKRSGSQLRAYWVLINSIRVWSAEQGNNYTKEDLSDYFKMRSGHTKEVMGVIRVKSISDRSETTNEDMKNLINTILDFGLDHGIEDCRIDPKELREMLKFYEPKKVKNDK